MRRCADVPTRRIGGNLSIQPKQIEAAAAAAAAAALYRHAKKFLHTRSVESNFDHMRMW